MKDKLKAFIKYFSVAERCIWSLSAISIIVFFIAFRNTQYHYLAGSLIGVTSLILVAKGNPVGQALTVVFSVFYGVISFSFKYYGEMITYLGMSAPAAIWAIVTWLKNPYNGKKSQVKVNALSKKEWLFFAILSSAVTVAFYFILRALGTANLAVSTVSVLTSFAACYLSARRSRFYAIAYALNDVVLIVMWSLACAQDIAYLPMIICFVAFLVNDLYGFINWTRMIKRQSAPPEDAATESDAQ